MTGLLEFSMRFLVFTVSVSCSSTTPQNRPYLVLSKDLGRVALGLLEGSHSLLMERGYAHVPHALNTLRQRYTSQNNRDMEKMFNLMGHNGAQGTTHQQKQALELPP